MNSHRYTCINPVRTKSKELVALIQDESRLKDLRSGRRTQTHTQNTRTSEDDDLSRAIAASKQQSEMDDQRRRERQEYFYLMQGVGFAACYWVEREGGAWAASYGCAADGWFV